MILDIGIFARYLIKRTLLTSMLVLTVFVLLDSIFLLIAEIEDISMEYNFSAILSYVFGVIPHRALIYLEGSCLLGLLISLSISKEEGNIEVLRSAGFSPIKISTISSLGAILLITLFIIGDEYYFKRFAMESEIHKNQITSVFDSKDQSNSNWIEDNGVFLKYYLKSDNNLYDVSVIKVLNNEVIFSAMADEASIVEDSIILGEPYKIKNFKENIDVSKKIFFNFPKNLQLTSANISNITLREQLSYIKDLSSYLKTQKERSFKSELERNAYKIILLPLSAIAIMLLAGSLIFSSLRDSTIGARIIIGVILSFIYSVLQDLTLSIFITYSLNIFLAAVLPIILILLVSFFFYRKI